MAVRPCGPLLQHTARSFCVFTLVARAAGFIWLTRPHWVLRTATGPPSYWWGINQP